MTVTLPLEVLVAVCVAGAGAISWGYAYSARRLVRSLDELGVKVDQLAIETAKLRVWVDDARARLDQMERV